MTFEYGFKIFQIHMTRRKQISVEQKKTVVKIA